MKTFYLIFLLSTCLLGSCSSTRNQQKSTSGFSDPNFRQIFLQSAEQYKYLMQKLPEGLMPRSFTSDTLRTCTSDNWIAGFYPGTLLYMYEQTKDPALLDEAIRKIRLMDKQQYNKGTHDLGFMMYCSYGNLQRLRPNQEYRQILLNSANSLAARFNAKIGCIRSWGKIDDTTNFRVIIDNMMNLELLFWAAKETADKQLYNIAVTHANTTLKNHFRPDNSSYHVVFYDQKNGAVVKKETAQGAANESAWARGQSWGLYGFTMMYRETKDKRYLDQANKIAKFILAHPNLPEDKIPFWDYNAPGIPAASRDASAAAIMASALIELAGYNKDDVSKNYIDVATQVLTTLSSTEYRAELKGNGGFLLKHSVANFPKQTEVDAPLPYADYYYIEALMRLKAFRFRL